jgi:hypothetical protein
VVLTSSLFQPQNVWSKPSRSPRIRFPQHMSSACLVTFDHGSGLVAVMEDGTLSYADLEDQKLQEGIEHKGPSNLSVMETMRAHERLLQLS